jgi:hypothetical protein
MSAFGAFVASSLKRFTSGRIIQKFQDLVVAEAPMIVRPRAAQSAASLTNDAVALQTRVTPSTRDHVSETRQRIAWVRRPTAATHCHLAPHGQPTTARPDKLTRKGADPSFRRLVVERPGYAPHKEDAFVDSCTLVHGTGTIPEVEECRGDRISNRRPLPKPSTANFL